MGKQENLDLIPSQEVIQQPKFFNGLRINCSHNNGSGENHFHQWEINHGDYANICFYSTKGYEDDFKDSINLMIRNVAESLISAPIFRITRLDENDFIGTYQDNFRRWHTVLIPHIVNYGVSEEIAKRILGSLESNRISMAASSLGDKSFFFLAERNEQDSETPLKIFRVAPITQPPIFKHLAKLKPLGPII